MWIVDSPDVLHECCCSAGMTELTDVRVGLIPGRHSINYPSQLAKVDHLVALWAPRYGVPMPARLRHRLSRTHCDFLGSREHLHSFSASQLLCHITRSFSFTIHCLRTRGGQSAQFPRAGTAKIDHCSSDLGGLSGTNQRVSTAIKYLTQSTWSHAAIFVGNIIDPEEHAVDLKVLIEADIKDGVIGVPLSRYTHLNTRVLRPG